MARTKKAVTGGRRKPLDFAKLQSRAKAIETLSRAVKTVSLRLPLGVYEATVEVMERYQARSPKQAEVLLRAVVLGLEALLAGEPLEPFGAREYRPLTGYDRRPPPEQRINGKRGTPAAMAEALESATPENPLFIIPALSRGLHRPGRQAPALPADASLDAELSARTGEPSDEVPDA